MDIIYKLFVDYKNPLHLDVVARYLLRMGDKTIPDPRRLSRRHRA